MPDQLTRAERGFVALMLAVTAACWPLAITQMRGMDMGVATTLGSFGFFVSAWVVMMAAMMLPGAVPAVVGYVRTHRRLGAAAVFVGAYVAVWTLVGAASYVVYRPHGTVVAGAVTIAAGLYELTPTKQRARRRCQQPASSGVRFGLHCLGSSAGLMLILLAVGAMSVVWMTTVAALVLLQKLVRPHRVFDVGLAVALVALGALILAHPSAVPGLVPAM